VKIGFPGILENPFPGERTNFYHPGRARRGSVQDQEEDENGQGHTCASPHHFIPSHFSHDIVIVFLQVMNAFCQKEGLATSEVRICSLCVLMNLTFLSTKDAERGSTCRGRGGRRYTLCAFYLTA
jgi:hypothetical protein